MLRKLIALSLLSLCSQQTLADSRPSFPLSNQVFNPSEMTDVLESSHPDPSFPETLQGIWWVRLQDNPPALSLLSLANSPWIPTQNRIHLRRTGQLTYAYPATEGSDKMISKLLEKNYHYEVYLNETHDEGFVQINYDTQIFGEPVTLSVPRFIIDYSMTYVPEGDYWLRESKILGQTVHVYKLIRLVQADGERTDAFDQYLGFTPDNQDLLVIK